MSESAVKANRRELRRAMGAEALKIVEAQGQRLITLGRGVGLAHERVDAVASNLKITQASVQALEAFQDRTFWGRLVWLVTGR